MCLNAKIHYLLLIDLLTYRYVFVSVTVRYSLLLFSLCAISHYYWLISETFNICYWLICVCYSAIVASYWVISVCFIIIIHCLSLINFNTHGLPMIYFFPFSLSILMIGYWSQFPFRFSANTHELFRGFSYVAPLLNEEIPNCNTPQVTLYESCHGFELLSWSK